MPLNMQVVIPIVVNIAVVAFGYGMTIQKVSDLTRRMKNGEDNQKNDHAKLEILEKQVNHSGHILPECWVIFNKINTELTAIKTKIEILVDGKDNPKS